VTLKKRKETVEIVHKYLLTTGETGKTEVWTEDMYTLLSIFLLHMTNWHWFFQAVLNYRQHFLTNGLSKLLFTLKKKAHKKYKIKSFMKNWGREVSLQN